MNLWLTHSWLHNTGSMCRFQTFACSTDLKCIPVDLCQDQHVLGSLTLMMFVSYLKNETDVIHSRFNNKMLCSAYDWTS